MMLISNVHKNYGSYCALKNITMELDTGVYGLLAPNGAGKTTLIKMLTTLIVPSEGEILYNGQNIWTLNEDYRAVVGYLPQQFAYYKNYSPKQYLLYLAALKGIEKQQALRQIPELLEKVALGEVMNKQMRKFSGGMIQRVGIAQSFLNDPTILILDEPTAGLDPKERARFRQLLSELSRDRLVLISTHIVSDIESIANEIIMIKEREILYKDTAAAICHTLAEMIFETEISHEERVAFRQNYVVISEKQEQGQMLVRFVCQGKPQATWQKVQPSLEDVFLYEYRDRTE